MSADCNSQWREYSNIKELRARPAATSLRTKPGRTAGAGGKKDLIERVKTPKVPPKTTFSRTKGTPPKKDATGGKYIG